MKKLSPPAKGLGKEGNNHPDFASQNLPLLGKEGKNKSVLLRKRR